MTGPAVDIFKQTIAGHSLVDLRNRMRRNAKREGEIALREIWSAISERRGLDADEYQRQRPIGDFCGVPSLPEIRHTDKIEVKSISDGFAEVSETTWQKLKGELFGAGLDETDVRLIARSLAKGEVAGHGGGSAPRYEYRKVVS